MSKLCALILPYFGKPKSYFQLFLHSIGENPDFVLYLYTDIDETQYDFPSNVVIKKMTLADFVIKANLKFGFKVSLVDPHKICDYKPSYGFLFEEDIRDFLYWGYCDCDLVFGNLHPVKELLDLDYYQKLFAAGHLTIFKNSADNNRIFMKTYRGKELYKIVYTHSQTAAFDEDVSEYNIHRMFLEVYPDQVYSTDLSFNVSTHYYQFYRTAYCPKLRKFILEKNKSNIYYKDGRLIVITHGKEFKQFIYCHLQGRNFSKTSLDYSQLIEICPKGFFNRKRIKQKNYYTFEFKWVKNSVKRIIHYKGKRKYPVIDGVPMFSA